LLSGWQSGLAALNLQKAHEYRGKSLFLELIKIFDLSQLKKQ